MDTTLSKSALARSLGLSRQSLYYVPKKPARDRRLRDRILRVLTRHHAYGHRRIAIALRVNKKSVHRIMRLYAIRPKVLPKNKTRGKWPESVLGEVPNRLKDVKPERPNHVWAGDMTRLWFRGRAVYLATIIDCYTREIVAWQMGIHHTTGLITDVLTEGKRKRNHLPEIFHSDQGSEYTAAQCLAWLTREKVLPSWSPKGKPWTNGAQESFFRTFKLEFGSPHEYGSLEMLTEAIGRYMHYYNTQRIHSRLKMPPRAYFRQATRKR